MLQPVPPYSEKVSVATSRENATGESGFQAIYLTSSCNAFVVESPGTVVGCQQRETMPLLRARGCNRFYFDTLRNHADTRIAGVALVPMVSGLLLGHVPMIGACASAFATIDFLTLESDFASVGCRCRSRGVGLLRRVADESRRHSQPLSKLHLRVLWKGRMIVSNSDLRQTAANRPQGILSNG
jgi:hypothetical protein